MKKVQDEKENVVDDFTAKEMEWEAERDTLNKKIQQLEFDLKDKEEMKAHLPQSSQSKHLLSGQTGPIGPFKEKPSSYAPQQKVLGNLALKSLFKEYKKAEPHQRSLSHTMCTINQGGTNTTRETMDHDQTTLHVVG